MVDFVQLQRVMKDQLVQDRGVSTIEVQGPTLEDTVAHAATLLNLSVKRLEYEITERGFKGFLGTGKKDWKIKAYQRQALRKETVLEDSFAGGDEIEVPIIEDKDGFVFVQLRHAGVHIKVTPPQGRGKGVTAAEAWEALEKRDVKDYDQKLMADAVKAAEGEYVKIGDFTPNLANDASMTVEIVEQEMKALLFVTPPGTGGCDISFDTYQKFLKSNNVQYGVDPDFLRDFADNPVYREKVVIAEGIEPVNGRDAYLQYNFEADPGKVRLKEGTNGRVDFKDLKLIQNVVEAQPLAKKIPAEKGLPGRTVTGEQLPAKDGKDLELRSFLGKNVHVADDGVTVLADSNGQVVDVAGKINVETVYTVEGNVCLKTGNIISLGTVIVTGNVEDGFSVKAAGNIEVNGTVEKAELDAEGDIIVHQGITGRGSGIIRAGKSVVAKFIENTAIEAGNSVIASDGIINSQVDAGRRISCQGKRATIVGGRLRAAEEINAKVLGSSTAGTETICEVGADPKTKELLAQLGETKAALEKQAGEIKLNIQTLVNIRKQRKSLPEDKQAYLKELEEKRAETAAELKQNAAAIEKAKDFLNNIQAVGRVSAGAKVYPGVRVVIKDVREDVRTEYKAVSFVLKDGLVQLAKYEEPEQDTPRGSGGNSAD